MKITMGKLAAASVAVAAMTASDAAGTGCRRTENVDSAGSEA